MKNNLRGIRAERNLTQAALAARLGVSRQTVNSIERGKYYPSLPLAFRIGRVFDLPLERIFEPEETVVPGGPHGLADPEGAGAP